MLIEAFHQPMRITKPASHTAVHRGEKIKIQVELFPGILGKVFPLTLLRFYRCWTCFDSPQGVISEGVQADNSWNFEITIQENAPIGEFFVDAYATDRLEDGPILRAESIGIIIQ
ncbi:MAG: hypothetical protein ACXVCE_11380 [Bacteriovorax sp.]